MRESVVHLLASTLGMATGGDAKKARAALTVLDLPSRLVDELLATPVTNEPETGEPSTEPDQISLKKINNVKPVKVTA